MSSFRYIRTNIQAAGDNETGQVTICDNLSGGAGVAGCSPVCCCCHCTRSCPQNRHLQPQAPGFCILCTVICILGTQFSGQGTCYNVTSLKGSHKQFYWIIQSQVLVCQSQKCLGCGLDSLGFDYMQGSLHPGYLWSLHWVLETLLEDEAEMTARKRPTYLYLVWRLRMCGPAYLTSLCLHSIQFD